MSTDLVETYLDFVAERHRIWMRRQSKFVQPWTKDPILATKKFTNVYRVLDHGSQFLLRMLQELEDQREILARAFLYRHTGRTEVWDFFEVVHGRYPLLEDLPLALKTWKQYRGTTNPIFTGAYLVFPQSAVPGTDKLESIINLTRRLFVGKTDIVPYFLSAKTQAERFLILRKNPGVADFMSMQILTDYGYTTEFRENEFVVPGPGAVKGAKILFPGQDPTKTVHWAHQVIGQLGIDLAGRSPSLMDAQNTLCEFSKYHRYMLRPLVDKPYKPAHVTPAPLLPSLW